MLAVRARNDFTSASCTSNTTRAGATMGLSGPSVIATIGVPASAAAVTTSSVSGE